MNIKGFSLVFCLFILTGAFAQVVDTAAVKKTVQTKSFVPKTQAQMIAERVKNLKFTPQNLADVKEAAKPMMKMVGVEDDGSDVLIILNGVKVPYTAYKTIDPNSITSMTIIKDKKGLVEYTAKKGCPALQELFTKKYNKAFIIETKKKEPAK